MAVRAPGLGLRIILTAILFAFTVAAWGSGIDRMSLAAPPLERLVPAPLRAQAERSAAAMALSRGDNALALEISADAVRADPLDPVGHALLGTARQLAGDPRGAEAAFRIAAQRGWREPITQYYWFDTAMRGGNIELAVLRADAILRVDPQFSDADEALFAPLEASEAGRDALAARLAEKPRWLGRYLWPDPDGGEELLRRRTQVALEIAAHGMPLGCNVPLRLANRLLGSGMRRDAERLWQAHCGDGPQEGGLADGGFERLADGRAASPFGWRRHSRGDVLVRPVELAAGGYAVNLRNLSSVSRAVLTQAIGLPPGTYLLRADIRVDGTSAPGQVVASLDCGGAARRPTGVSGDLAGAGQRLTIGACESQMLGLWLRPGAGEVTIDDLAIEPLG